jgi:thymidylate synthase
LGGGVDFEAVDKSAHWLYYRVMIAPYGACFNSMYKYIKPFGYHVSASSIGETWLDLVEATILHGEKTHDEKRERMSLQNVRILVENPTLPDELIEKYGDKKKIEDIVFLTFKGEKMYDCDVKPSFSPGPKSYYARLKEGKMEKYIVERLAEIPESKKAIISFIHWDDYKAVLENPYDDYLPCIVSIQFRLLETTDKYAMTVNFNSRSIDAFQKCNGNMIAIYMLAKRIEDALKPRLKKPVKLELIDGMITDAHIYEECYQDAIKTVNKFRSNGFSRTK